MERSIRRGAGARAYVALLVGSLAILSTGCSDSGPSAVRRANIGPVGPEESFGRILESLKRRLEHGPRRSVVSQGLDEEANETSTFSFQDQVSGEVIKPAQEGDVYRAKVIIKTHSDYILTQTVPESSEPRNGDENGSLLSLLDETSEAGGETTGEDLLASPELGLESTSLADSFSGKAKPEDSETTNGRTQTLKDPHDTINRYDLLYQEGRWVLETKPEKESIKRIFEYALEGQ